MLTMTTQSSPQLDIESKLAKLQACIDKGQIKASIQLCDSLLKVLPDSDNLCNTLLKNKARLMILGKQFSSLTHLSKKLKDDQLDCIRSEIAYAHYRLGNYTKTLETIKDIDNALLRAQILYRLDNFKEAINEYEHLINDTSDSSIITDLLINLSACKAALVLSGDDLSTDFSEHDSISPEYLYNHATLLIGRKEFNDAKEHLEQAIEACDDELIRTQLQYQLAYCNHHLGLPLSSLEPGCDKLVNSLILVLTRNDSPKRLASTIQSLMPKYATYQKNVMKLNLALLHYELGKAVGAKSIANALLTEESVKDKAMNLLSKMN